MRFVGTATDRSWVDALRKQHNGDLRKMAHQLHEKRYTADYGFHDEWFWLSQIRTIQKRRYYLDEVGYDYPY